jgi:hypothetical protein
MDANRRQEWETSSDDSLDKPLADEGYAMMGAVFEVHRELGGGLLEEVYQEALEIEFKLQQIPFVTDEQLRIYYKDQQLRKWYTLIFECLDGSCSRSNPSNSYFPNTKPN